MHRLLLETFSQIPIAQFSIYLCPLSARSLGVFLNRPTGHLISCWFFRRCTAGSQWDWPTYGGDHARSGIQTDRLAPPLQLAWQFVPKQPPRPAWQGEAKWDGWNKVYDLKHRQDFDHAFHIVGDEDALYFGSSSEDKVICLGAQDGKIRWTFFTEGPVRLAPTLIGESLFVGSDDGHIYRLRATDGP